ncbi:MAG: hypothetical protein WC998_04785 [Candidatus Paceibacterota bacterium]|jgi:hypothetical protein
MKTEAEKRFDKWIRKYAGVQDEDIFQGGTFVREVAIMYADYCTSQLPTVTDEEIEKKFPTDLKVLCEIHKIPVNFNFEQGEHLDMVCRINMSKQTGAKWMRNKIKP